MNAARIALLLSVLAAVALLIAGPGSRMGWWEFRDGFALMKWAAYGGLAASALAVVLLLVPRVRRLSGATLLAALVVGLAVAFVPWNGMRQAKSVPPIHDISTDTEQPPAFVAILPLRADAPNPAEYGGPEVAAAQRAAYPDLQSHRLSAAPGPAFEQALAAARDMGWEIVAAEPASGRIEATDTTRWFGFKDDVVVRIAPDGDGSRVDVRSVSRVGASDVGTNARRIRAYLARLGT